MSSIRINTPFNVPVDFEIAPFHKRLAAYLVDLGVMVLWLFGMKALLYDVLGLPAGQFIGLDIIVISIPMLFYSLLAESLNNGQTLGKKILRIRVMSPTGGVPSFAQFILRWVTKFFEWPFLFGYILSGFIWAYLFITGFLGVPVAILILVTKKHQRLGDMAADTVVVETRTALSVRDTIFMDVSTENYRVMFPSVMRLTDMDLNTVKNVLQQVKRTHNYELSMRVEYKIKQVLEIDSKLSGIDFLARLLEDYNYLATHAEA